MNLGDQSFRTDFKSVWTAIVLFLVDTDLWHRLSGLHLFLQKFRDDTISMTVVTVTDLSDFLV